MFFIIYNEAVIGVTSSEVIRREETMNSPIPYLGRLLESIDGLKNLTGH